MNRKQLNGKAYKILERKLQSAADTATRQYVAAVNNPRAVREYLTKLRDCVADANRALENFYQQYESI